jgi:predicted Zn-dependent protease
MPALDVALDAAVIAVLAHARNDESVEAYGVHRTVVSTVADTGGAIRQVDQSDVLGVGVRLVSAERTGYSATTDFSTDGLRRCVEQARVFAALSAPDPAGRLLSPANNAPADAGELITVPLAAMVSAVSDVARRATSLDRRVQILDGANCRHERATIQIASTTGIRACQLRSSVELWVDVVGGDAVVTSSGSGYRLGRTLDDCDPSAVAAEAVIEAVRLLGPRVAVPGRLPVICAPAVTAAFVEAIGRALVAPLVRSRRGALAGGLGSVVGSSFVTLVDDGRNAASKRAGSLDDEGYPRQRTTLIDHGTIRSMLQFSGTLEGSETSTGNATRGSYKSVPTVGPTTLVLEPTDGAVDVGTAADVVVLQQLGGARSGVNSSTGRIDVAATGYLRRGGEPVGAFAAVPLSSTLADVLTHVDAVAADGRNMYGTAVLAPTIRLGRGWLERAVSDLRTD